jgi:hypothetical protein
MLPISIFLTFCYQQYQQSDHTNFLHGTSRQDPEICMALDCLFRKIKTWQPHITTLLLLSSSLFLASGIKYFGVTK